jgi:S-adenosylmethionine synthetase
VAGPNASGRQLFTSESVSMGHPDKVCDQVSDAILDSLIGPDPMARTAIETMVTTGLVVVAGEVTVHNTEAELALANSEQTIRETIKQIGYDDSASGFDYRSCAVLRSIHGQSADISQGVTAGEGLHGEQGAGDQGLMFGYACDETDELMPLPIHLSHRLVERLAALRQSGEIGWLRPDSKSQVTIEYEDNKPVGIDTIVLSTQHTEEVVDKSDRMSKDAIALLIEKAIKPVIERECGQFWSNDITFHINPTGKFVIGGPHGDAGLTGRKIIVDTYGGRGRHGGGAFSGKDPTKVDRSACYMCRYIAKNIVAAGLANRCEVQLAYAIGVADPVSVHVEVSPDAKVAGHEVADAVQSVFKLTPAGIIETLDLRRPIFFETARHGHFGRSGGGFTWERTDRADALRDALKGVAAAI